MAKVTPGEVINAITQANKKSGDQTALSLAVRLSLDWLAQESPGHAVELRVPPFRVVQLIEGINHRRGTPPAIVEIDPNTWLALIAHEISWLSAESSGLINASGENSNLSDLIKTLHV